MKQVAAKHGLILVDTKYEFGKAPDGSILLIDEVSEASHHFILNVMVVFSHYSQSGKQI